MDSKDRLSSLPDHLLHHILRFLPTQESVRTSVLSRRWQRVWIGLPTFAFDDKRGSTTAGFADSVDAVLAQGTLDRLEISVRHPPHITRANEWLQRAAERVREDISIIFHENLPTERILHETDNDYGRIELHLPCGGRTTALTLYFQVIGIAALVIPPAVPSSLTQLELRFLRVDASSLSDLVSSRCPHLRKLVLHTFGDMDALTFSNNVLEDLDIDFYSGGLRRLEVWSRNLRRLCIRGVFSPEVMAHDEVHDGTKLASFFTPRLEDLCWTSSIGIHPSRIDFAHSLSTVRQLEVALATHSKVNRTGRWNKLAVWLLRRCTGVWCLRVRLCHLQPKPLSVIGVLNEVWLTQYKDLMVAVPHLSTVTDLTVSTLLDQHAYGASIATLLSRCSHIETLTILVKDEMYEDNYTCALKAACWCKRPADWREQKLRLHFLRQVNLKGFTMADWLPDLVSLLCDARPNVIINYCD